MACKLPPKKKVWTALRPKKSTPFLLITITIMMMKQFQPFPPGVCLYVCMYVCGSECSLFPSRKTTELFKNINLPVVSTSTFSLVPARRAAAFDGGPKRRPDDQAGSSLLDTDMEMATTMKPGMGGATRTRMEGHRQAWYHAKFYKLYFSTSC